jgi:hypothetical protein
VTTLDAATPWHGLFRSRTKGNGARDSLFGRHALNTTSVVTGSTGHWHANRQEHDNLSLDSRALSLLGADVTTLLPDPLAIDPAWLQVAVDEQPILSASLLDNVNWSARQPGEIALGVRMALAFQDPLRARAIVAQGHRLYPDDGELARLHRVLAPPVTTSVRANTRPDTRANLNWLAGNREVYYGKWVALDDGRLLANADSIADLIAQVGDVRDTDILITQVW